MGKKNDELRRAWEIDTDETDQILALHYAKKRSDKELKDLNEAQITRLAEMFCGPADAMDSTEWLERAVKAGNPYAAKLLERAKGTAAVTPAAKKPKKKKKKGWLIALAAVLLLAAAGGGGYYWWNYLRPVETDPTQFIEVAVDGLNGFAEADVTLDTAKITEATGREVASGTLSMECDKNTGLSNGDVIHVSVSVNEEAAKKSHLVFTETEYEYTVEGLQEPEKVDVFEGIEVTFSGEDGSGTVTAVNTSSDPFLSEVTYTCEPDSGLSIGDVIQVTASVDPEIQKKYGKVPEYAEKDATVVSLNRYITRRADMSEAGKGDLYAKGYESLVRTLQNDSGKYEAASGESGTGNAVIKDAWVSEISTVTPRNGQSSAKMHNRVIMIYEVLASDSKSDNRHFFYPVVFEDVLTGDTEVISYTDESESEQVWLKADQNRDNVYKALVQPYESNYSVVTEYE